MWWTRAVPIVIFSAARHDGRVLTVPLKGYGYLSGFVCIERNPTDGCQSTMIDL